MNLNLLSIQPKKIDTLFTGKVGPNLALISFPFKDLMLGNVPTRHFYSPCETKTTLLHLSPTSSKVKSNMQSTVTLVVDRSLVQVMICTFVTILKLINQKAILDTHINFLLAMSMAVNKQRTFLLVNTRSLRQKLKSSTEKYHSLLTSRRKIFLIEFSK